jgi:hypothetical protein
MFKLFGNGKVLPFFLHPMNPTQKLFFIYRITQKAQELEMDKQKEPTEAGYNLPGGVIN